MPRDGNLPQKPEQPRPPTREEIILAQRNDLCAQLMDAEAAKAMLINELAAARQRIAELEAQAEAVASAPVAKQ